MATVGEVIFHHRLAGSTSDGGLRGMLRRSYRSDVGEQDEAVAMHDDDTHYLCIGLSETLGLRALPRHVDGALDAPFGHSNTLRIQVARFRIAMTQFVGREQPTRICVSIEHLLAL